MYIKVSTVISNHDEITSIRGAKKVTPEWEYNPDVDIEDIVNKICDTFVGITKGITTAPVYISFTVLPEEEMIIVITVDKRKSDGLDTVNGDGRVAIIKQIEQALVRRHPEFENSIHRFCWEEVDA